MRRLWGSHHLASQALRYLVSGGVIWLVYTGLTLLLEWWGMSIYLAVVIAYVVAVSLHFVLQRVVVWARDEYALSVREQVVRYVALGLVQLAVTFAALAVIPGATGLPAQVVFVVITAVNTLASFVLMRQAIFRPGGSGTARE